MFRSITFTADDLDFIKSININDLVALTPFINLLKEETKTLVSDENISLELSDNFIGLAVLAEGELAKSDSGILNHIAIQFFHNC
jgi:hypothetical protein